MSLGEATAAEASSGASAPGIEHRGRFRALYDANYHQVLGFALRRTANRQDAEDVVAETFFTAWRRLDQVPAGAEARLWLYGVARNALANQRRGERRRIRLAGALHAETSAFSSHGTDAHEELSSVAAALARLSHGDRELLTLAAWEGLDAGEIGTVIGCSRNAARIRLHRARQRFARELERVEEAL